MASVTAQHAAELSQGAEQLGVYLSEGQHAQLLAYLALLIKWNKAFNLTAVRNPDEMVSRHLLDSLSVLPHVAAAGDNWLDVGSGAGPVRGRKVTAMVMVGRRIRRQRTG